MRIVIKPLGAACLGLLLLVPGVVALRNSTIAAAAAAAQRGAVDGAVVYSDALRGGWTINGWAREIQPGDRERTPPTGGTAVRARIDRYLGVKFMHTPTDTGPFDRLSFLLNGGPRAGQRLHVQALLSGKKTGQRVLLDTLPPDRWVRVTIPLTDLQVDRKPDLTHFWIQDTTGQDQEACYIADVRFLAPGEPAPEGGASLTTSVAPRENW